ncbi:hypothetical protein LRC537489_09860 [Mycobacterium riyadhense]
MATPSGRLQRQPKKANGVDAVFCAIKISSRMRIRKPAIKADHKAPARVNLDAGSLAGGRGRGAGLGRSGEPEGVLLVIVPSWPLPARNET